MLEEEDDSDTGPFAQGIGEVHKSNDGSKEE
jgi:hypothetical protein